MDLSIAPITTEGLRLGAVQNGNLSALHALVRHGGDLYDTDILRLFHSSGNGAIWSDDHTATFKQLIRWGADVDATGADVA